MILTCFEVKKDVSREDINELILKLNYIKNKKLEQELIFNRIKQLKEIGYTRKNCVTTIQYEFAKKRSCAYLLVKDSQYYE